MDWGTGKSTLPLWRPGSRTLTSWINPLASAAYHQLLDRLQTRSPPLDGSGMNSGCDFGDEADSGFRVCFMVRQYGRRPGCDESQFQYPVENLTRSGEPRSFENHPPIPNEL